MRTKPQNPNIDTQWFKDKLAERKYSMRSIAKIMGLDPSTVSLMFRGVRGISSENAVMLAELFNVTPNEIFKKAGAPIVDMARTIPVASYIDQSRHVRSIPEEAQDQFGAPYDVPTNAYVCQNRTGNLYDGWALVVDGTKKDPEQCIGMLTIYCREDGTIKVGLIRRGYMTGTFNVHENLIQGGAVHENQRILWCQVVMWVKPISH